MRLKSLIQGHSVKRQAASTLRCMQTLARVQSQIRSRRIRMSEENQALQRQLQQRCEKELEKLRTTVSAPILYFLTETIVLPNTLLNCCLAMQNLSYGFPFYHSIILFVNLCFPRDLCYKHNRGPKYSNRQKRQLLHNLFVQILQAIK